MVQAAGGDEEGGAAMKTCLSTDQLEVDLDAASDVSSEMSFGYEFAQAEVMMKAMGNNGKPDHSPTEVEGSDVTFGISTH